MHIVAYSRLRSKEEAVPCHGYLLRGNGRDAKEASGHEIRQAHGMESISLKQRLKMNIILSVAMQWV